jgi:hypothetical protein
MIRRELFVATSFGVMAPEHGARKRAHATQLLLARRLDAELAPKAIRRAAGPPALESQP